MTPEVTPANVNDVRDLAARAMAERSAASLRRERRPIRPIDATRLERDGRKLVNFSGNDYLGLAHDARVAEAIMRAARENRVGSGSAALVVGYTDAHRRAERALAAWKGVDDAVLLPSGYQANVAAIQSLAAIAAGAGRKPRFLVDKLVHASLIDAVRSTETELRVFPHNGLAKLARLLDDVGEKPGADRLDVVVTESIFSMDGDRADLAGIVALRRQGARFALVVDEAHATGLYGPAGAGLVAELGLTGDVDLGIATFSKAAGVIGGAVYGPSTMVDAVVNLGRAYLYTTAVPPLIGDAVAASIEAMRDADDRRARLRANVDRLRAGIARLQLATIEGDSPIVPAILGDAARTLDASRRLAEAGHLVIAVRPPTVAPGTSRLRITVNSEHTVEQVDGLLDALTRVK
jgi:8-amino-7-oxononanoate synthase